jgi:arylsulfatase A-like enzyme
MNHKTTRREFLTMTAGAMLASRTAFGMAGRRSEKTRANIVVLFIDDLGYGDVGIYGAKDVPTPNIDKLAAEGTKFTNAYTICPVCSPSRTALMLGMYPQKFGMNGNNQRGHPIPQDHPTLAETLRDAGYVTGMVGRWDIGSIEQGPLERGFMEVARRSTLSSDDPRRALPNGPTYMQQDGAYWTEQQGKEMADFVTRHKDENFFLYFAPLAIHYPVEEVPQKYIDRVPKSVTDQQRRYLSAAMIAVDDAVGELMRAIKQSGLDEKTLVFFTGDNGGKESEGSRNTPYRGGKVTPWEGAVREPFIVRWKGTLPAGRVYGGMTSTLDIYATSAAAAGTALPEKCDGVNLLPYIKGEKSSQPHDTLYWRWLDGKNIEAGQNVHALRHGKWRLMRQETDTQWRLYDIEADPGETSNLADKYPDVVEKLSKMYEKWTDRLPEPLPYLRAPGGHCPGGKGWATPENP